MPSLGEMRMLSGVADSAGWGVEVGSGMDVAVAVAGMDVGVGRMLTSGAGVGAGWHAERKRTKRGNIFFIIG
ncbi:MAG: hypothetical protein OHK003_19850 [Anaerolineales bacterium]